MPLLMSPIDGSPMKQINRFGIEIDVCPTSGGVWLDKGELEKIMAMLRDAAAEEQGNSNPPSQFSQSRQYAQGQSPQDQGYRRDNDDDDDDDDWRGSRRGSRDGGAGQGRKSGISRMMELFDF